MLTLMSNKAKHIFRATQLAEIKTVSINSTAYNTEVIETGTKMVTATWLNSDT